MTSAFCYLSGSEISPLNTSESSYFLSCISTVVEVSHCL
jgi:hypothetical protein